MNSAAPEKDPGRQIAMMALAADPGQRAPMLEDVIRYAIGELGWFRSTASLEDFLGRALTEAA